MNLPQMNVPNPARVCDLAALLLGEEETARAAKLSGQKPGAVTGFAALDEELGGFLTVGVHTLLAAPGAGKTSLALQIAAQSGVPCLYVTSEMRRAELLRRLIARETGTFLGRLRGGELDAEALETRINATAKACPMLALFDVREERATRADIEAKARALREQFDTSRLLIVVDSVTDWAASVGAPDSKDANEYAIAERAITGVSELAASLSCPVVAIAHRNRTGQGKDADKLHAAKGTGRYEYVSESLWDLERDAKTEPDANGQTEARLTILKNRHGSTGSALRFRFEGRIQKFTEA